MDQFPRLGKRELICLLSPLPLGAWDELRYFIVALPEPSISLFFMKLFNLSGKDNRLEQP